MTEARFTAIDLAGLTPPDVVEALDYEVILTALKTDFISRWPEFNVQMLESDPAIKVLEVAAYRELVLRARVNDAARAVMLATSTGNDLDHLGALFGVQRMVIGPILPSVVNAYESDERLRTRIQLALEAFSTAGPEGAYIFHALTAHAEIMDVRAVKPSPGRVDIVLLSSTGSGAASSEMIEAVFRRLNEAPIRPLTDMVRVMSAKIVPYDISVRLKIGNGPSPAVVKAASIAALTEYTLTQHKIGEPVYIPAVIDAAIVPGSKTCVMLSPLADIDPGVYGACFCSSINVAVEVIP